MQRGPAISARKRSRRSVQSILLPLSDEFQIKWRGVLTRREALRHVVCAEVDQKNLRPTWKRRRPVRLTPIPSASFPETAGWRLRRNWPDELTASFCTCAQRASASCLLQGRLVSGL